MSDYIKREDAKDAVMNTEPLFALCKDGIAHVGYQRTTDVIAEIDNIPSADVAPVRHGRWEVIDAEEPRRYGCSECKRLSWHMENYCPNCGARMDAKK